MRVCVCWRSEQDKRRDFHLFAFQGTLAIRMRMRTMMCANAHFCFLLKHMTVPTPYVRASVRVCDVYVSEFESPELTHGLTAINNVFRIYWLYSSMSMFDTIFFLLFSFSPFHSFHSLFRLQPNSMLKYFELPSIISNRISFRAVVISVRLVRCRNVHLL